MSELNKMIVRRVIEDIWNRGNYATIGELVASDYVGHSSEAEGETYGREGYRQYFSAQREAFPDIHYAVDDQVAEGDRVATRWSASATHMGEFQGIPPTSRQGSVSGVSIFRIANGCIIECWTSYDALGLLQQLGILPAAG